MRSTVWPILNLCTGSVIAISVLTARRKLTKTSLKIGPRGRRRTSYAFLYHNVSVGEIAGAGLDEAQNRRARPCDGRPDAPFPGHKAKPRPSRGRRQAS